MVIWHDGELLSAIGLSFFFKCSVVGMGTRTFPEVHAIMMLSAAVRHPWRHRSPPPSHLQRPWGLG